MRFRRGPRKASEIQKKNLIENAKDLANDPMKVIPKCGDSCLFCKFGRAKRKIKKIKKYSDNEKKLEKYANRGPDLSKAVAGTILFGIQEEAKKITTAKTPEGEIAYAKKGDASTKRLTGIQHFPDPKKRLIAYSKEAEKGYYFYSVQDKVICTCKKDKPPKPFVKSSIKGTEYDLKKYDERKFSCGHEKKSEVSNMKLNWESADISFTICEKCADDSKNLFKNLTKKMISPDNSKSFTLQGELGLKCESDCENCNLAQKITPSKDLTQEYFEKLSDKNFIDKYSQEARKDIENKYNVFIIGELCFGEDKKSFVKHIDHEKWERPALAELVKKTKGAVLNEGTVNEFLEKYWENHKKDVLSAIFADKESIEEVLEMDIRPREKLRELRQKGKKKEKLDSLPDFKKLPPEAEFADSIARVYKVKEEEDAITEIENYSLSDKNLKSIAYGFYVTFGKEESKKWKYEGSEVETGEFLSEFIEKLLESEGKDYAENLQQIVKMSGSTEAVVLKSGKKMR